MLKTMKQIQSYRRERFRVPNAVQAVIPVQGIWEDGTFQHSGNLYSRSYRFTDINYAIASQEQRERMNQRYQELLNALGGGATYKITTNNRRIDLAQWETNNLMPDAGDGKDEYRHEYNARLRGELDEAEGRTKEMYLTVTVWKQSPEEARTYFNRCYTTLQRSFQGLGSRLTQMKAKERLQIFHDFFRPGDVGQFDLNLQEIRRRGHDFRDTVCPPAIEKMPGYLKLGDQYARALICVDYGAYVRDDLLDRLTEISRDMMISVDVISIPTDEARQEVQLKQDGVEGSITRWQQRQNRHNNFSAVIPYELQRQREEMQEFMDDLLKNNQGMHLVTVTLIHTADTLEQLNSDTERLAAIQDCKLFPATFQQLDAMATALPFGVCKIDASRTLLTRCLAAVSQPFKVQEIQEPGGISFGRNALTGNQIICNQENRLNHGMFILGVSGGGKSMMAKMLIVFYALATEDQILINDPSGEYAALIRALGGTVISLAAGGEHYINALDMELGYGGELDAVAVKSQFIQSLFEQMEEASLTAQEQSVLDRCVRALYADAQGKTVTLADLRELLLKQPEPQAKKLALTMERYTTGSLDVFAHETNVDTSKRILCFDLHEMRRQLRPAGQLVVADMITNRISVNQRKGIHTHVINDEIQEFFKDPHTKEFLLSAWQQWRKKDGYPVGITPNVALITASEEGKAMLGNSEMVIMLSQAKEDEDALARTFHIPAEQLDFIQNAKPGCGLLRCGESIIPFRNEFPKDTKLYQLMTTKPEDGYTGGDRL